MSLVENKKLKLLKKLKRASDVYRKATNDQKIRLFDACQPLVEELLTEGYPKIVSESLLMFGSEFYWKEHIEGAEVKEVFEKEGD